MLTMNDREQLTKMYNDGHNDGYKDGYNEAISLHCKGSDQSNSDMYSVGFGIGFDEGYAHAEGKIHYELEALKNKLEEAERFQAFWRECYHIEHNKLILAENKLKRTETQSS